MFVRQLFAQVPAKARLKVEAIEGDCASPGLGLSDQDRCVLISKIHVVIHAAATVRFDEKLPLAVSINVKGTQEILDLAREMPNLQVSQLAKSVPVVLEINLRAYGRKCYQSLDNRY